MLLAIKVAKAPELGRLVNFTHVSSVKSPVIEREAESLAERYCEEAATKSAAEVEAAKGREVVTSVTVLWLVRVLLLPDLSLRSKAMSLFDYNRGEARLFLYKQELFFLLVV